MPKKTYFVESMKKRKPTRIQKKKNFSEVINHRDNSGLCEPDPIQSQKDIDDMLDSIFNNKETDK